MFTIEWNDGIAHSINFESETDAIKAYDDLALDMEVDILVLLKDGEPYAG